MNKLVTYIRRAITVRSAEVRRTPDSHEISFQAAMANWKIEQAMWRSAEEQGRFYR